MEKGYHKRFKERFTDEYAGRGTQINCRHLKGTDPTACILAFIDEEIRKAEYAVLNEWKPIFEKAAKQDEHAALIEKVEGRKMVEPDDDFGDGWNQALDDILTHLQETSTQSPKSLHSRGDLNESQAETECCCEYIDELTIKTAHDCPEHGHPAHRHKPRTEEAEKEDATFSGREIKIDPDLFKEAEFKVTVGVSGIRKVQECDCWLCAEITETLPRPKETPTPQSREQGGEKKCAHRYDFIKGTGCVCRYCKKRGHEEEINHQ